MILSRAVSWEGPRFLEDRLEAIVEQRATLVKGDCRTPAATVAVAYLSADERNSAANSKATLRASCATALYCFGDA